MINTAMAMFWETLLAIFMRIKFKAVLERFLTRLIIMSGDKLVKMTSNDLDDKTWNDIKANLKGKLLKVKDKGDWSE